MKVYELAKELGKTNEEVVKKLKEMGLDIDHHLANVEDDIAQKLRDAFNPNIVSEIFKENEFLKEKLAEMEALLESLTSEKREEPKDEVGYEEIPEIPMNKVIKVMSLFSGGLNLKTSNDGNALVFRFESVGQIFPILYSDLVKIISNQRAFFEQGYCMILDKDVVKAHYFEEHYKKFVDAKVIKNILSYDIDKIKDIFINTMPVIQQSIVDVVVEKINNYETVDRSKVMALSEAYGQDIFKLADKLKQ